MVPNFKSRRPQSGTVVMPPVASLTHFLCDPLPLLLGLSRHPNDSNFFANYL